VSAIRINSQTPDGKNDCETGKNDVAVLVKNGGGTSAGSFAVQLAVDGSDVARESVAKLDAAPSGRSASMTSDFEKVCVRSVRKSSETSSMSPMRTTTRARPLLSARVTTSLTH
jgi:hypothetical protein